MTHHRATRAAAITAAAFLSILATAPMALASTNEPGASAEHRNDGGAGSKHEPKAAEDLEEPQPASNADFSGSGANEHGAYDSTRDGSPSENGNGEGTATGQPCAGCVGNADNKNPPGQAPDGSDANNGYECDGNAGIGRTNPAHTGCVPTSDEPTDVITPLVPLVPLVPVVPVVVRASDTPTVVLAATVESTTTPAAATPVETMVLGISIDAPESAAPSVLGTTAAAAPAALATTGSSSLLMNLAMTGMALVLGGLALAWTRRGKGMPARG